MANITNVTTVTDFLSLANQGAGGGFWVGTLYMIMIVLAVVMSGQGIMRAAIAASIVTVLLGVAMQQLGLISMIAIAPAFSLLLLLIFYTAFSNRD